MKKRIGELIKQKRIYLGISRELLAEKVSSVVKITVEDIEDIELSIRQPTALEIVPICVNLDLLIDEVVDWCKDVLSGEEITYGLHNKTRPTQGQDFLRS